MPREGIGEAVSSGDVSLDFLGLSGYDRFSGFSETTFLGLHERTGIPLTLLQAMREAIGFAAPGRTTWSGTTNWRWRPPFK